MNFGTYFSQDDDMEEEWYHRQNAKKVYDIIYRKAVLLHETNAKYDKNYRKSIVNEILQILPNLPLDQPKLFTKYCYCMDRLCDNKKGMSEVIYSQILEDLKNEKLL